MSAVVAPLRGRRIVITRHPEQADELARPLAELGATPILAPVLDFVRLPLPAWCNDPAAIAAYTWILFTSANAVRFFIVNHTVSRGVGHPQMPAIGDRGVGHPQMPAEGMVGRIACVGPATAQAVRQRGLQPDFIPAVHTGAELARTLPGRRADDPSLEGQRILLPRALHGRPEIVTGLRQRGAEVDELPVYTTRPAAPTPAITAQLAQGVDMVIFTSPSSVRYFCDLFYRQLGLSGTFAVACLGPTTAAAARDHGLSRAVESATASSAALVAAIADYYIA